MLLLLPLPLLPLLVDIRPPLLPTLRLHSEKHVEYVLRVYVTVGVIAAAAPAPPPLPHLRTVGTIPVVVGPFIPIAQACVSRSNSCQCNETWRHTCA